MLKILQLSAQGSITVAAEIRKIVETYNIYILLLQEPYVYKGKVKGYGSVTARVLQNHKNLDSKAAIIIYNKTITVTQIEQVKNEHIISAHIRTQEGDFYIITIYCQYSHRIERYINMMEDAMSLGNGSGVIMVGDVNACGSMT